MEYYVNEARQTSQEVLNDLNSGQVSHLEARRMAHELRNAALDDTRARLTPGARRVSEAIKEEGRPLPALLDKYSREVVIHDPGRFGVAGNDAAAARRAVQAGRSATAADLAALGRVDSVARTVRDSEEVSRALIQAAGRTSPAMTVVAKIGRVAGPAGVLLSLGSSAYEIARAEPGLDTARVATRETGGFAGGWLGASAGGLAAGWTASLLCGPGAAVCAIVVTLLVVGGAAYGGGRAGEWAATSTFDALMAIPDIMVGAAVVLGESAAAVVRGVGAAVGTGLGHLLYAAYGSLDPGNWIISQRIPSRTRVDLAVVMGLVWAQMRPMGPMQRRRQGQTTLDAFLANSGAPLSSFGLTPELARSIAAGLIGAAPSLSLTGEELMRTTPAGLMAMLTDAGLLLYREDPVSYTQRVLTSDPDATR